MPEFPFGKAFTYCPIIPDEVEVCYVQPEASFPFPTPRPAEHHEVQPPVPLRPSRSLFHPPTLWLGVFLLLILLGSYNVHPVSFSTILLAGLLAVLRSFVSFHAAAGISTFAGLHRLACPAIGGDVPLHAFASFAGKRLILVDSGCTISTTSNISFFFGPFTPIRKVLRFLVGSITATAEGFVQVHTSGLAGYLRRGRTFRSCLCLRTRCPRLRLLLRRQGTYHSGPCLE